MLENGQRLKIGDKLAAFEAVFPRPRNASIMTELPAGIPPSYSARGWEKVDGGEGAGALVYGGRVALVLYQIDKVDSSFVSDTVRRYEQELKQGSFVTGQKVRYWFWSSGNQTLMLCAMENSSPRMKLTIAMGIDSLMDRIGATPENAKRDRDAIQRLFGPPIPDAEPATTK